MPQWPHEYVVRNWRPDKEPVFERFVMHIRDHGYDAPFLDHATYRYLEIDGWKYWTMGEALNETTIINRAKVEARPSPPLLPVLVRVGAKNGVANASGHEN
jgi:endo-alpha-1,4-polygalactosaminidase (GH114 family)